MMCDIQQHLLKMGAKLFDPYNISALSSIPKIECRILVHKRDTSLIHRIPNLLRLKRHLVVIFLLFDSLMHIHANKLSVVFPCAGAVIMDMPCLVACKSGMSYPVSSAVQLDRSGKICCFLIVTILKLHSCFVFFHTSEQNSFRISRLH